MELVGPSRFLFGTVLAAISNLPFCRRILYCSFQGGRSETIGLETVQSFSVVGHCTPSFFRHVSAWRYEPLTKSRLCGRGGIGKRAALGSQWRNTHGSSSLLDRTKRFILLFFNGLTALESGK